MTTKTILTDEEIRKIWLETADITPHCDHHVYFARAIEQAILQSPEIQALRKDKERLDWLADPNNNIGNVQLPRVCVERNLHSLRAAIDDAMEREND